MKRGYWFGLFILIVVLTVLHAWKLSEIPRGLYLDEASVGVNALAIATNGHDEHGHAWPVYFKAFGEYKNPLYIYVTAGIFKIFGPSDYALRFPGVIFIFLSLIGGVVLGQLLWPRQPLATVYIILVIGLLPWFWPMSRVAFETISQLPAWIWLIVWTYWAYEKTERRYTWFLAILMGLTAGLSVYTYSTSRLLTFIYIATWLVLYVRRGTFKYSVLTLMYFILSLIPYIFFSATNPGALTDRFRLITYIYDSALSLPDKISLFFHNYGRQFSPDFLLFQGDHNTRHATGFGGELYIVVALLSLIGLIYVLVTSKLKNRWTWLLVITLIVAPVAAALTTGETGHALRTITEALMLVILSGYGLLAVSQWQVSRQWHKPIMLTIFVVLILESGIYLWNYWVKYPAESAAAFESYNIKQTTYEVLQRHPGHVFVAKDVPSIHVTWYAAVVAGRLTTPFESLPEDEIPVNSCVIRLSDAEIQSSHPIVAEINPPNSQFNAVCY